MKNPIAKYLMCAYAYYELDKPLIEDFEFDVTEDLLGIIRKGLVGSKFIFHSLLTGGSDGIEFDV